MEINNFDFEKWQNQYVNDERIDVNKFLKEEDRKILEQLEIEIMSKIYTEYEFEILQMELSKYYFEIEPEDYKDENKSNYKSLKEKNVSNIKYLKLLDTIDEISEYYNI